MTDLGFEALDGLSGVIGGERHGVWDYTWVAHRRFAPLCYASLYAWDVADERYIAEIWARLKGGRVEERSLVGHLEGLADPADTPQRRLLVEGLRQAATRALQLTEQRPPEYFDEAMAEELRRAWREQEPAAALGVGIEPRIPYVRVLELVDSVLSSAPQRVWTNQEILRALLEAGYTTDRADVNSALSELAAVGRVQRVSRGHYTRRGFAR